MTTIHIYHNMIIRYFHVYKAPQPYTCLGIEFGFLYQYISLSKHGRPYDESMRKSKHVEGAAL